MSTLESTLDILHIPSEYARPSALEDLDTQAILNEWKRRTGKVLRELKSIIEDRKDDSERKSERGLEIDEEAELVFCVAPFLDDEAGWTTPESRSLADDILPASPTVPLISYILKNKIKSLFSPSPHPYLSRTTARALPRAAGGPGAAQDYYEGQLWKEYPGLGQVLHWCIEHIPTEKYEELWPLVIPPTMTLLDDYEEQFKIRGVYAISCMLKNVPPELLKRTGLDGLLRKSLSATVALQSAPLLEASLTTLVDLIKATSTLGTEAYFDQLCELIGESIVNDTWFYAYDKPDVLVASVKALVPIIEALQLGSARFLNALIPQLTHPLRPVPMQAPNTALQIASLRALNALIVHCAPRMHEWKVTIVDGIARCWVDRFVDEREAKPDTDREQLKQLLQDAMCALALACPSVETEIAQVAQLDRDLFRELFCRVPVAARGVVATPRRPCRDPVSASESG
ncbi:hypothetical protein BDQ17DRAFT_1424610 [Cyathus striatus]|nr:hypothetical protein BDQ17DRAFT_1424610 [Cyathus striatus]